MKPTDFPLVENERGSRVNLLKRDALDRRPTIAGNPQNSIILQARFDIEHAGAPRAHDVHPFGRASHPKIRFSIDEVNKEPTMTENSEWSRRAAKAAHSTPAITVLRDSAAAKGGREIFNVATLERAAERLAVATGERPLNGRLKYLRTMNFPSPVPRGRGRKSAFGLDDLVQTLFALELIDAGMVPTRAIRVMRTGWTTVKASIAYGWSRANKIGPAKRAFRALVLAPSVLSELGSDDRAEEPLHEVMGILSDSAVRDLLVGGKGPRRMLIMDTQAFAIALASLDEAVLGVSNNTFSKEMQMFCAEAFGTTDASSWDVDGAAGKAFDMNQSDHHIRL